jgi:hypothetical protein
VNGEEDIIMSIESGLLGAKIVGFVVATTITVVFIWTVLRKK